MEVIRYAFVLPKIEDLNTSRPFIMPFPKNGMNPLALSIKIIVILSRTTGCY